MEGIENQVLMTTNTIFYWGSKFEGSKIVVRSAAKVNLLLGRFETGLLQAPFFHFGQQGGGFDTEEFRSSVWPFYFPIGPRQREQKIVAFQPLQFGFRQK